MNIAVCVKQVPDTTLIKIDPITNTIIRESVESILNPFDLQAIEEAVKLKEKYSGKVFAITMGPPKAEEVLREAISIGADEAILLSDKNFAGADTYATSYTLSKYLKKIKPDIILTGKQAIDGDTGQVGPGIAEHLGITHITEVSKIESVESDAIVVDKTIEQGIVRIKSHLPILLSVLKDINTPRVPGLKGRIRANKSEIVRVDLSQINLDRSKIGINGSPTRVSKIFSPKATNTESKFFSGEPKIVVNKLLSELKKDGVNIKMKKSGLKSNA